MDNSIVNASSLSAESLFRWHSFTIPDYQRVYSWGKENIEDFYRDLKSAKENDEEYFLGLVITAAGEQGRDEVVDGQQRLISLVLLMDSLRRFAREHKRHAIAENIEQTFLYQGEKASEKRELKVLLSNKGDRVTLERLLADGALPDRSGDFNADMIEQHKRLRKMLEADLKSAFDPGYFVREWRFWIFEKLSFILYRHPDRNSAYSVFITVNTRGKDLAPTDLIKAYLIGQSGSESNKTVERLNRMGDQLRSANGLSDAMTTFVRHVHVLRHPYVTNRKLFAAISEAYSEYVGVESLLLELEKHIDPYMTLLDPSRILADGDGFARAAAVFRSQRVTTIRPLLLAMNDNDARERDYAECVNSVMPYLMTVGMGSGANDELLAGLAHDLACKKRGIDNTLADLKAKMKPDDSEAVIESLCSKKFYLKPQVSMLFEMACTESSLPPLRRIDSQEDTHRVQDLVRPDVDDEDASYLLGNWQLAPVESGEAQASSQEHEDILARTRSHAEALVNVWYEN